MMKYIYDVVSDHEGLLPPSEATYTLHELVHVAKQIMDCGPPMMVSMFKYERQNKYLKKLLKNQRYPLGSIVRNYLISEMSTFLIGTSYHKVEKLKDIFQFVDKGISENVITGLNSLRKLKFQSPDKIICENINMSEQPNMNDIIPPCPTLIQFLLDPSP